MTTTSDEVKLVVRIPRESYENMKIKAQGADVSINKFLNRAGSIVTTQQIANFPLTRDTNGAASTSEIIK